MEVIPLRLKRNVLVSSSVFTDEVVVTTKGRLREPNTLQVGVVVSEEVALLKALIDKLPNPLENVEFEASFTLKDFLSTERKLAKFVTDTEKPIKVIKNYVETLKPILE